RRFSARQDEAAFAEIVTRHQPMLLRLCQRVLHNGHDAEDICQAAFLLLPQKVTSTRWRDSVAGWLYQVAHRMSLKDSARWRYRRRRAGVNWPGAWTIAEETARVVAWDLRKGVGAR